MIPTNFPEDRWVTKVEWAPGDRKLVHHILSYIDTTSAAEALDRRDPGPGYTCFGGPGFSPSNSSVGLGAGFIYSGTLSGTYGQDFAWGRFEATGSVYHSGGYRWEYTNTVTTSPYSLLNANITFAPNANRFKYTLYGKNLANKAYVQGALPTAQANMIFWSQPREIGVSVGYSF